MDTRGNFMIILSPIAKLLPVCGVSLTSPRETWLIVLGLKVGARFVGIPPTPLLLFGLFTNKC